MRCAVIARHRDEFPVRLMCRVLDVSVSGFYAFLRRPLSWRRVIDEVLMAQVRIAFMASGDTYGAPRVWQELQAEGLPTSQKRVARLMREAGPPGAASLDHGLESYRADRAEPARPPV